MKNFFSDISFNFINNSVIIDNNKENPLLLLEEHNSYYQLLKEKLKSIKIIPFSKKFELVTKLKEGYNFKYPFDLKVNSKEKEIYIADRENQAIKILDLNSLEIKDIIPIPAKINPRGLFVDRKWPNIIYVSCGDSGESTNIFKINKFTKEVIFKYDCGNDKRFITPSGMIVDDLTNRIYLCEEFNDHVRVISSENGEELFTFGHDHLSSPCGIDFTIDGDIIVSNFNGGKLFVFTKEGGLIKEIGVDLNSGLGVKVDPTNGDIYLCESWGDKITVFDRNGEFLKSFVGSVELEDQRLNKPYGIDLTHDGRLVISEKEGCCVTIYK
ncbi:hypothetical protein ABK040_006083 [Willaertia magna]